MKAIVIVTPKKTVLDPQGVAVKNAIHHLGMECVEQVHVGKYMELEISGSNYDKTLSKLKEISRDLLSNPVIEDFKVELITDKSISKAAAPSKAKTKKAVQKSTRKAAPKKKTAKAKAPAKKKKARK